MGSGRAVMAGLALAVGMGVTSAGCERSGPEETGGHPSIGFATGLLNDAADAATNCDPGAEFCDGSEVRYEFSTLDDGAAALVERDLDGKIMRLMIMNGVGEKIRLVYGYKDGADIRVADVAGEPDGDEVEVADCRIGMPDKNKPLDEMPACDGVERETYGAGLKGALEALLRKLRRIFPASPA